jgi:rhodanese-related sulfurtransferase
MTSEAMRDVRRLAILIAGSTAFALLTNALGAHPVPLFGEGPGHAPRLSTRMTVDEFRRGTGAGKLWLLLDVRAEEAFRQGHPEGALNAPAGEFLAHYRRLGLASILKAADGVVVLCESAECFSGDRVAALLEGLGPRPVRVLHGGWKAWRESGAAGRGP